MKKQKNVPELRFPEFERDWNEFKLSKLIRLISGQHLTPNEYSIKNGEVPYFTGPSDFTNDSSKIKKWTVSSDKYAQKGDILITVKGNGVGEMLFLELPRVIMGRQLMAIRPVKAVGEIIYQFLFTHKQQLQALASGNVIPGLSRSDILNIKIYFSTLEEQEKIASFLSAVDKKLTQLRRKKELLETYKRGLMQKLFSQQIRFKQDDGTAFPDWEEKSLGELGEFKNGFNADKQSFGSGIEFVNLMDIFGKNEITKTFLERVQIPQKQLEQYKIKKGDVLFVRSSVKRSGVGQSCLVNDDFEDTVYSGFIIRFREKYNDLIHFYKKYCFSSLEFRENILSVATSSANTNINQESLAIP